MHLNDRARRGLTWLLLAVAVVVTAAVYWPGVTGGWVFDDYPNIVSNAAIHITRGHSSLATWVNVALSSPASFLHRPLASITFALNWMMGGGDPMPFKITNIVIHLINGVLLFCMLRALLRLAGLRGAAYASWIPGSAAGPASGSPGMTSTDTHTDEAAATRLALIVSAAWMLLPINLMAVLYVVQRMESLCQIFVVAGLWMYLHGRWMMVTANEAKRDRRGFALAVSGIVLGTVLGLTSKETAVLLPAFAFLAEWIVIGFGRRVAGRDWITGSGVGTGMTRSPEDHPGTAHAEPRIHASRLPHSAAGGDKRIWALFTVTLFVPAVLGFAWLLRGALRPGALAGRDFTLVQRLMTEPRVIGSGQR